VWKSMLRGLMSTRCASFAISRSKPGIMLSIACVNGRHQLTGTVQLQVIATTLGCVRRRISLGVDGTQLFCWLLMWMLLHHGMCCRDIRRALLAAASIMSPKDCPKGGTCLRHARREPALLPRTRGTAGYPYLDEGDVAAERRVHVRELEPDVAAADNGDPVRQPVQLQGVVGGEHRLPVDRDPCRPSLSVSPERHSGQWMVRSVQSDVGMRDDTRSALVCHATVFLPHRRRGENYQNQARWLLMSMLIRSCASSFVQQRATRARPAI